MKVIRASTKLVLIVTMIIAFSSQVRSDSTLVAYWSFDESLGDTIYDYSGSDNHGIKHGGIRVDGVSGKALSLDGEDDFVEFGNPSTLNPQEAITLEAWFKPVTFSGSGNDPIIDKGFTNHTSPYYQYHLGVSGSYSTFSFSVNTDGEWAGLWAPDYFYVPGRWYHIVGTYDGSSQKLIIDGIVMDSAAASGNMMNFGKGVQIGKFSNLSSYLPGTVDEVRIYSRALSSEEIQRHFDPIIGDANDDGLVNVTDAVYLIQYIFADGSIPAPIVTGDANCDGTVNITDAVYLINYIFSGGPAPCEET